MNEKQWKIEKKIITRNIRWSKSSTPLSTIHNTTSAGIGTESPNGPFTLENVTKETAGSLALVETKDDGGLFLIIFKKKKHFLDIRFFCFRSLWYGFGINPKSNKIKKPSTTIFLCFFGFGWSFRNPHPS